MKRTNTIGIFLAVLAAALYAINAPFSKLLLAEMPSTLMAGVLYIGAGLGMGGVALFRKLRRLPRTEERILRADLPYTLAMIVLDILAPIFLLFGLSLTTAANASLLNNFEIVATALIALVIFREQISPRLWLGIGFVASSCALLSFEDLSSLKFSLGSVFILLACLCWGIENNCTRMISNKSSIEIVVIKGTFSGLGSLIVAWIIGERIPSVIWMICVLLLGFVAYGLSIYFYVMAQKDLGAAKTSAYYSIAPFLGVVFGMLFLGERPAIQFYVALIVMMVSTYFMIKDTIGLQHTHEHTHTHTHEHAHGDTVHTHEHTHTHTHIHVHGEDSNNHEHHHKTMEHEHLHAT